MEQLAIDIPWSATFASRLVDKPKSVLLLLHGYQQRGAVMLNQLARLAPPDQAIIAPDGLFPVPVSRRQEPLRLGFSWYVFDPSQNAYLIEMDVAVGYIKKLLEKLNLADLPTRIVGFSMGGYLAPHVGLALPQCRHVIGINGRFRSEVLTSPLPFVIDGIAGADDVMVDPKRAQSCHEALIECGSRGTFYALPGEGHKLTTGIVNQAETLVQNTALTP